jgi:aspartate aminotransferase
MISPELTALLEPLERFEAIRRRVVRLGDRLCDLSYANFYGGPQKEARDVLRRALEDDRLLSLQYSPFGGQALSRRAVADALRSSHALPFEFSHVVLTPGAMAALQLALRTVGGPGDEVLVPVPCWLDYPLYVRSVGMHATPVPLAEPSFRLDLAAIQRAITPETCAILLSTPNNPTGSSMDRDMIRKLAALLYAAEGATGRRVTVIADETHRDFSPPGVFSSIASEVDSSLIVFSFGKRHFMQGQRLGYVTVSPRHPAARETADEIVRWARVTGIATPTAVMQRAVPGLLTLDADINAIAAARSWFRNQLIDLGYEVVESDSTFFLYARTPPGWGDIEFIEELARRGTLVLPAQCFHHSGYFRLSLSASQEMLERALAVFRAIAPPAASVRLPTGGSGR